MEVDLLSDLWVFLRGVMLGVVIAAPVGPVGLLCIKRTLQGGFLGGLATGLGAGLADMVFGAVAAFGITAALSFLAGMEKEIRVIGGAMLVVMAIQIYRKHVDMTAPEKKATRYVRAAVSGFVVTITNPLTIIGILAVVATFAGQLNYIRATILTAGLFCGSLIWWTALTSGIYAIRKHFTSNAIKWVNRGTAVLLLLLAFWAIGTGVAAYLGVPLSGPTLQHPMDMALK